jgi:competence protein ComEC
VDDRWALVLAAATLAGALRASPLPIALGVAVVAAGLLLQRPVLLCVGAALLASALGQRALDGLDGLVAGPVAAEVTLLTDPDPVPGGVRADVRLRGRHLELRASGTAAAALAPRLAGERVLVHGDQQPVDATDPWLLARHVAGRVTALRVDPRGSSGALATIANGARRTLVAGARPLSDGHRALYTGLVIGDDRAQPAALTDDFRGAGLTHLLAVSGQNVAFLLTLAGPLVRRLRLWPRLLVTLVLIGGFVVLTRAEPSVSRAGAMAALAAATVTVGRPVSRLRVLCLAVTVLVLVDPLLVHALGFRLSAGAALAIVTLAPAIGAALPGPRWLAEPLGVTVAAQIGVAPLLVTAFGPLPLASVPANLLAVPAAGLVMAWGMSAGLLAGVAGGVLAEAVHLPTRLLLDWIELVARRAAAAPLGHVGPGGLVVATAGLLVLVVAGRPSADRPARSRRIGLTLVGAVVLVTLAVAQRPPALRSDLGAGAVRWHGPGTDVVVLGGGGRQGGSRAEEVLEALRHARVGAVDLLVVADDRVGTDVVPAVTARHPAGLVVRRSDVPAAGATLPVGSLLGVLVPGEDRLIAEAWPAPGTG